MVDKDEPHVMLYRMGELEESVARIEEKLDRVIENFATKEELAEAVDGVNSRMDRVEQELEAVSKKQILKVTIAIIAAVLSLIITAITLYDKFN